MDTVSEILKLVIQRMVENQLSRNSQCYHQTLEFDRNVFERRFHEILSNPLLFDRPKVINDIIFRRKRDQSIPNW